jgi:transcriptional regulator with PAS, ATPase and Fis domain
MSHHQLAEKARVAAEATARASRLESRVRQLTDELDARAGCRRVIGESPQWLEILRQAAQVSATETTVLLTGESGTGKEVVARLIHRGSPRCDGPFVALNCAALPEHLLEAELFGYEQGAFTGAMKAKPGQIEQTAGGVAVPGRSWRNDAGRASQVPARATGARISAAGWHARDEGQRTRGGRNQS